MGLSAEHPPCGWRGGGYREALALLRRAYNLGRKASPPKVARMLSFEMLAEQNSRQGFFEHEEYRAILRELPAHLQPILTFAYFTGCRRGEILGLQWSQVDLQAGIVRLPPMATKNRDGRIIPLTAEVVGALQMQKTRRELFHPEAERVFCFDDGQPVTGLSSARRIACRRAGLVDAANKPTKLLHDCRRSAVRNMVRNMVRSGTSEKVCMAISGHKTRSIFDRYDIVSEKDLMAAAKRLSDHVNGPADVPQESAEKPIRARDSGAPVTLESQSH